MKKRPLVDRVCIRVEVSDSRWESLTLREAVDRGKGDQALKWVLDRIQQYKVNSELIEDLVDLLPPNSYVALKQ